jgi:putative hydroxymethylpyrimidine transport system ATP-binding protein
MQTSSLAAPSVRLAGSFSHAEGVLFENLELTLPAQSWTCLLGVSGVGKSTLLRLLAGLSTGGRFDGSISAHDGLILPERIAYMGQSDLLPPWLNVRESVTLGARLRGDTPDFDRADTLIDQVGLSQHAHKLPKALSGGMRQRAALARTLMESRPIALLDEPFSALDARTRADMQELAHATLVGRTVLLVTHDPGEAARLGDVIYLMSADGLESMPVPTRPPIRAVDAHETLQVQTQLLQALRSARLPSSQ